MLSFLLPRAAAARAASCPTTRLSVAAAKQSGLRRRHSSSFAASLPSRDCCEEDADDADNRGWTKRHNTEFSHFFDKRTPAIEATKRSAATKPKASYEVQASSRHVVSTFRQAVSTRDPASIIEAYRRLKAQLERHLQDVAESTSRPIEIADTNFPVRKADIQTAIRTLIHLAQKEGHMQQKSVEACQQMFTDMERQFGFRIGPTDLHRQLQTHCLSKSSSVNPSEAFEKLRTNYPDWQTTSVDWNIVISSLVQRRLHAQAVTTWGQMQDKGVEAGMALRNTMIRAYLALDKAAEAESLVQHSTRDNGRRGIDTLTTAVEGLCKLVSAAGKGVSSERLDKLRSYAGELREALESHPDDRSAWHALLHYEALTVRPSRALETARQAYQPGLFDRTTLCMLLRLQTAELSNLQSSDEALELLERVRSAIDARHSIESDDQCYNILMLGLLSNSSSESAPTPNQLHEAQTLYNHARSIGIQPSPLLITPLLTAYCSAFLPSLDPAMALVKDLVKRRSTSKEKAPPIGIKIIAPVIDACVKLGDVSTARTFLSLFSTTVVKLDAVQKTQLIRRLVPIATSWSEAFSFYRTLSRLGKDRLDSKSYSLLLQTFCSLSLPSNQASGEIVPAPPEDLLGMLQGMSSPSCVTYTTILDYYAKTSPSPSYLGIRATHELLKRDESLEPDLPLINALMNAYNRADEPSMVIAIWDSLLATRQGIDGVTLSVFFDTAGRHGLLSLARKALASIRRIEEDESKVSGVYVMTKGAWDSYLECLARCGRLEEAIELGFGEMRRTLLRQALESNRLEGDFSVGELVVRSTQGPVKDKEGKVIGPDSKTFGTLLKFAARQRDRRHSRTPLSSSGSSILRTLRARIREEMSWLYPSIKHIGE